MHCFFFSSRRRHTRLQGDWSSDVCSSDLFELADGGTIFLDEIGNVPLRQQAKLLRVLESGEIERVGSSRPRKVNVRVLSATNTDLTAACASGQFREDLLFRLNTVAIHVPALPDRPEDIPVLAAH